MQGQQLSLTQAHNCSLRKFCEGDESAAELDEQEKSGAKAGSDEGADETAKCTQKEYCCVASIVNPIRKRPAFCCIHYQLQWIVELFSPPPPSKPPDKQRVISISTSQASFFAIDSNELIRDMQSFGYIYQAIGARRQASSLRAMLIIFATGKFCKRHGQKTNSRVIPTKSETDEFDWNICKRGRDEKKNKKQGRIQQQQ